METVYGFLNCFITSLSVYLCHTTASSLAAKCASHGTSVRLRNFVLDCTYISKKFSKKRYLTLYRQVTPNLNTSFSSLNNKVKINPHKFAGVACVIN